LPRHHKTARPQIRLQLRHRLLISRRMILSIPLPPLRLPQRPEKIIPLPTKPLPVLEEIQRVRPLAPLPPRPQRLQPCLPPRLRPSPSAQKNPSPPPQTPPRPLKNPVGGAPPPRPRHVRSVSSHVSRPAFAPSIGALISSSRSTRPIRSARS